MANNIPGIIMGFREGLEAFLVIAIILRYLSKLELDVFKKYVAYGVAAGAAISIGLGMLLEFIGSKLGNTDIMAKLWESGASIAALVLVTTFIIWMIKHGSSMTKHIESEVGTHLSKWGIFLVSSIMVAREGVEIAIFTFAGDYSIIAITIGLAVALILTVLIFKSLVKVNLGTIFKVTLIYLILQAGYLLGYGIHEGLSALKSVKYLTGDNLLLIKLFDLSHTVLNHKDGIIGLPLNVLFGWYSKPEWIQFVCQYAYTVILFIVLKKEWKRS